MLSVKTLNMYKVFIRKVRILLSVIFNFIMVTSRKLIALGLLTKEQYLYIVSRYTYHHLTKGICNHLPALLITPNALCTA